MCVKTIVSLKSPYTRCPALSVYITLHIPNNLILWVIFPCAFEVKEWDVNAAIGWVALLCVVCRYPSQSGNWWRRDFRNWTLLIGRETGRWRAGSTAPCCSTFSKSECPNVPSFVPVVTVISTFVSLSCGLTLKPEEVETLWKTFALAADGLYTWSKFCQRYVSDEIKLKQALRGQPATPGGESPHVATSHTWQVMYHHIFYFDLQRLTYRMLKWKRSRDLAPCLIQYYPRLDNR